jgi:hypothetical protein
MTSYAYGCHMPELVRLYQEKETNYPNSMRRITNKHKPSWLGAVAPPAASGAEDGSWPCTHDGWNHSLPRTRGRLDPLEQDARLVREVVGPAGGLEPCVC